MKQIGQFFLKIGGWIILAAIIIWRVIRGARIHNSNIDALTRERNESRDDADRSLRRAIKLNRDARKELSRAGDTIDRLRELDRSDREALRNARNAVEVVRAILEIRETDDRKARELLTE
jgi:hypothetical protein